MPSPFRTPTPALGHSLLVLLRAALPAVIGLCALVHGVSGGEGRPHSAVTSQLASVAGDPAPHGPHRHHGDEECALDAAVLVTGQAAQHAPPEVGTAVLVGVSVARVGPVAGRTPYRRRGRRAGRTALVRTSRWRI
ncbi:hypothetical protein [Streptomyces sp. NPDC057280]|uniref:hypothetical protein n=1 Tax=Streptomyces sp. NPDC057280 TaxID=3346081 RepID=UPI0036250840